MPLVPAIKQIIRPDCRVCHWFRLWSMSLVINRLLVYAYRTSLALLLCRFQALGVTLLVMYITSYVHYWLWTSFMLQQSTC